MFHITTSTSNLEVLPNTSQKCEYRVAICVFKYTDFNSASRPSSSVIQLGCKFAEKTEWIKQFKVTTKNIYRF